MKKNLSFVVALVVVALLSACKTTAPTLGWKPTVVETDATASIRAAERQRDNSVRSANQSLAGVQAEAEIGLIQRSAVKPFEAPSKKEQPCEILPVTEEPVAKPERVKPEKMYLKESTYETSARAIGVNIGYGIGVSYQHSLDEDHMIDLAVNLPAFYGIGVTCTCDWVNPFGIAIPWNEKGSWNWNLGVGAAGGIYGFSYPAWFAGVAGHVGIAYDFWFPLELSLDWRLNIGVIGYDSYVGFNGTGLYDGIYLGVRYLF